jgi:hypothetical protein
LTQQNKDWHGLALNLDRYGLSKRKIAELVEQPKSTVSDFLRKYSQQTKSTAQEGETHLFIPDSQIRPGVDLSFLTWIGKYIVRKRPDVIIHAGDFADMESLSSYDKGKRTAEGKRLQEDIDAAKEGMRLLLAPLRALQAHQKEVGEEVYNPRLVLTLGNHENRIERHVDANPELYGFVSTDSLGYKEMGWEVYDYLKPVVISGVAYSHFFPNVMTGKPLGGTANTMLKTIGTSFSMGHRQTLDVATRFLPADGTQQWGLVAGACYLHSEDYKGPQGNHHWRGIVLKHNVKNGSYDPLFISLDWLQREYGQE